MQTERSVKGRERRGLSEGRLAALLIMPAMLLIACIAVYPVLRTVWYSLFDLRLNHPTRNETNLSYSLDLEKYADGMYTIHTQLSKAIEKAETEEERASARELLELIGQGEHTLFATRERQEQLAQVDAMVSAYQPVNDRALRFLSVSGAEVADYKQLLQKASGLAKNAVQKAAGSVKQLEKASQALDTLSFAVVEPNFAGLGNYVRYLGDERLWTSVFNTTVFTLFAVSFELLLGMLVALLMNQNFRGRGVVRASVLIPWSIPASTSAIIWKFMYDGQYGIVAKAFAALGIVPSAAFILTTRAGSMFGMIVSDVWKTTPFMALLLLAGLQTIDQSLYEAAKVDGSGKFRSFFSITLPLLKPTMLVSILFRTLDTFKAFDLFSVMTYGANDTESISLFSYKVMFAQMDFGSGSTISIILFFFVLLICLFYIKGLGTDLFSSRKA
ncbi:MAG: sugar ABC transporter permease [Candidatus Limiplasma sp.]|nr:sugar ABC transporter permease [Candidatus Limiplasma sp.]